MRSLEQRNFLLQQNLDADKNEKRQIEMTITSLQKKMEEA